MLIERVVLENYKSIARCDVKLPQVCFVVGPNGSGKSNFLDSLLFLADCDQQDASYAMGQRGGFLSTSHQGNTSNPISIAIYFQDQEHSGSYVLQISHDPDKNFIISSEHLDLFYRGTRVPQVLLTYKRDAKSFSLSLAEGPSPDWHEEKPVPKFLENKILIETVVPPYSLAPWIFHNLKNIKKYNVHSEPLVALERPPYQSMASDGQFIKHTLLRLREERSLSFQNILHYLSAAVPSIQNIEIVPLGSYLALYFHTVTEEHGEKTFEAFQMSDGTLSLLGYLTALFQHFEEEEERLILLEEPERALHPAAAGVLREAIMEAGQRNQILVTTHNDNLLDHKDVDPDCVLVAQMIGGQTYLGPIDPATQALIRERRFTVGELMRTDLLHSQASLDKRRALLEARDWT